MSWLHIHTWPSEIYPLKCQNVQTNANKNRKKQKSPILGYGPRGSWRFLRFFQWKVLLNLAICTAAPPVTRSFKRTGAGHGCVYRLETIEVADRNGGTGVSCWQKKTTPVVFPNIAIAGNSLLSFLFVGLPVHSVIFGFHVWLQRTQGVEVMPTAKQPLRRFDFVKEGLQCWKKRVAEYLKKWVYMYMFKTSWVFYMQHISTYTMK